MKNKIIVCLWGVLMPQKIKIPSEEKIRIVTAYLAGKYGFNEAAQVAGVSRSIFGRWVHQYKSDGPTVFIPVERKTKFPLEIKKAAVEELKAKIAQLEHEKYMLQMENDFLKKLDEVERRRH